LQNIFHNHYLIRAYCSLCKVRYCECQDWCFPVKLERLSNLCKSIQLIKAKVRI
jgi:hypothetical protein